MRKIPSLTALCAALALILNAPSAGAQNQTQSTAKSKAKHKSTVTHHPRHSPSGHPEWDVYVRGEYVGSDPDPRIRSSIRREATRSYGFH